MNGPTTGRTLRRLGGACSIIVATAWSAPSYAQEPAPPPAPEAVPYGAGAPPPAAAPLPPPPPAAPPVVQSAPAPEPMAHGPSDLDVDARRWAIGYTGLSQVPVGLMVGDLTVPALGLRYWTSPTMGFDLGFGFGWAGGSTEMGGSSMDKDGVYGFVIQGGVPLALAAHRHVAFEVIPFADIAYGWTSTGSGATEVKNSGVRVDVGARAGLEIFFGFIGIPELSLSATVGLEFAMRKHTTDEGGMSNSDTALGLTTTVQNNPWDIFAGNVAARYYF